MHIRYLASPTSARRKPSFLKATVMNIQTQIANSPKMQWKEMKADYRKKCKIMFACITYKKNPLTQRNVLA